MKITRIETLTSPTYKNALWCQDYTCAAQTGHAAERGWVWFRRWQSAVGVVDCQYRRIEVM